MCVLGQCVCVRAVCVCVCLCVCARTRVQGLLRAEQGRGPDNVDHAAGVALDALHGHGQVADLRLQLQQQRAVYVQQSVRLRVLQLQGTEALLQGRVQVVPLLRLGEGEREERGERGERGLVLSCLLIVHTHKPWPEQSWRQCGSCDRDSAERR